MGKLNRKPEMGKTDKTLNLGFFKTYFANVSEVQTTSD